MSRRSWPTSCRGTSNFWLTSDNSPTHHWPQSSTAPSQISPPKPLRSFIPKSFGWNPTTVTRKLLMCLRSFTTRAWMDFTIINVTIDSPSTPRQHSLTQGNNSVQIQNLLYLAQRDCRLGVLPTPYYIT